MIKEVRKMEQVIKERVKRNCDEVGICFYEETNGSIRVYPYSQIVSANLVMAVEMIKEEYPGFLDYYIGYDPMKREIYISVGDSF
jgi:hypothetical protein